MTPHEVPEGHDHFYGFSRWSKEVMPYNWKEGNIFDWFDIDCIFDHNQTRQIHIVEIKVNDAKLKAHQFRKLKKLENLGCKIHLLRMYFDPKYFGDHENLGDPRLADKIILDNQQISYEDLIKKLNEWHGTHGTQVLGSWEGRKPSHRVEEFM